MNAAEFLHTEKMGPDSTENFTNRSGRKTVPVWASFSAVGGAGPFVKINARFVKEKYLEILENEFLPWVQEHYGQQPVRFIQDRPPIHTARVVTQWFRKHPQIQLLPWPSKEAERIGFILEAVLASLSPLRPRSGNPTGASLSSSGDS